MHWRYVRSCIWANKSGLPWEGLQCKFSAKERCLTTQQAYGRLCRVHRYDADRHAIVVDLEGYNFLLDPANVRRNDTSAASINEWTGERLSRSEGVTDDIKPDTIAPLGNYAVQILWQDGFNQVITMRYFCLYVFLDAGSTIYRSSCSCCHAVSNRTEEDSSNY